MQYSAYLLYDSINLLNFYFGYIRFLSEFVF